LYFGGGPRLCPGYRAILLIVKFTLIGILRDYILIPGEHMHEKFYGDEGTAGDAPRELWVKLIKRHAQQNGELIG
jgi:hypothetical protein